MSSQEQIVGGLEPTRLQQGRAEAHYANIDELADPSLTELPFEGRRRKHLEDRQLPFNDEKQGRGHEPQQKDDYGLVEHGQAQTTYDIPDEYANIDELADPSPIEVPFEEDKRAYLEDRQLTYNDAQQRQKRKEHQKNDDRTIERGVCLPKAEESSNHSDLENVQREKSPAPNGHVSKFETQLHTISYLIFFSILGTLARLGLQALTVYPGAPVQTGVLWANFGGSLVMGFLSEDRALFYHEDWGVKPTSHKKRSDEEQGNVDEARPRTLTRTASEMKQYATLKKSIPLYIGLATGFCGSFTSFSSFICDAFLALSDALPVPVSHTSSTALPLANLSRNGGYSFMATLAVIILTVNLSLGALQTGAHLAIALEHLIPSIPYIFARRFVDRAVVFIAWMSWLGAIFMAAWPPDRPGGPVGHPNWTQEKWRGDVIFALVFAPLGCLLRFYASLHLNGRLKSFPLGTFAVNILGTALEGIFYDLQHIPLSGRVGCQVLQGAMDGFCGCLTTVSTWASELKGLRLRHSYLYGVASLGVGLGLLVVVMGSLQWTHGFKNPTCGS